MYKTFSQDYDRFVNWENRLAFEIPFIEKQVASLQQRLGETLRILDAACGTGMHAIALAEKGHHVSAADLSPEMVEKSRANSRNAHVNIHVKAAGFGELYAAFGPWKYDLLLCLGNSLPHLLNETELANALADFALCLRPGGRLLIQNRNFDSIMEVKQRWMEAQTHQEGDVQWVFQRFYDFEPGGLIRFNIVTLKRAAAGPWEPSVTSTTLRPQLQSELTAQLSSSGFKEVKSFGSMDGQEFDRVRSGNLVLTAIKK